MNHYKTIILILILIGTVICGACITTSSKGEQSEVNSALGVTQGISTEELPQMAPPTSVSLTTIKRTIVETGNRFNLSQINESTVPCLSYDLTSHSCDADETINKKIILQAALKTSCVRDLLEEGGEIIGVGQVFAPSIGPSHQRTATPRNEGGFFPGIFIQYKDMRISFGVDLESRRIISQVQEVQSNSSVQEPICNFTSV